VRGKKKRVIKKKVKQKNNHDKEGERAGLRHLSFCPREKREKERRKESGRGGWESPKKRYTGGSGKEKSASRTLVRGLEKGANHMKKG